VSFLVVNMIHGGVFVLPEEILAIDARNGFLTLVTGTHPVSGRTVSSDSFAGLGIYLFQEIGDVFTSSLRDRQIFDYSLRLSIGYVTIYRLARLIGARRWHAHNLSIFFFSGFVSLASLEYWPRFFRSGRSIDDPGCY
jgi:hypothetical protein